MFGYMPNTNIFHAHKLGNLSIYLHELILFFLISVLAILKTIFHFYDSGQHYNDTR